MIIMSVDLGLARTGLAVCDKSESFVFPREVIHERNEDRLIEAITKKAKEENAELLVMGLPKNMNGSLGSRAEECKSCAEKLEEKSGIKTVLFDERCTTMAAENYLNLSDTRGKKRKQEIDAVAAVIILEDFIRLRKIK